MKVLVTGGAGYIGSTLVPVLLDRGYEVRVFDSLMFGGHGLLPVAGHRRFEFVQGDVRDPRALSQAVKGADAIIHLAAIVGAPACNQNPQLAKEVNVDGTINVHTARSKDQLVIFASTGSNYGAVADGLCTEETPLRPLSVYGVTKTQAEGYLLEMGNAIVYRFATAFGASPRLRLDLLPNYFVHSALTRKELIVFEKDFKRTFIHVKDIARALAFAIENADRMRDRPFNVGSEKLNMSKEELALLIKQKVDYFLHFAEIGTDEDQRDYEVSYARIRALGYDVTVSMEEGIDELIRAIRMVSTPSPYSNLFAWRPQE